MATSKSPSKSTTDKASSQEHRHGEQAKARDNNNEVLKYGQVGAKLDSSNQVDKQQLMNILKLNLEGASTDPRKQLGADQKWALSQAADGTKVTSNRSLDQRGYRVSQEDDVQRVVATADMYVHYVEFVYRSGKKQTFHFSEWTGDASHSMEQLDLELRKGEYLSKVAVANDSKGVRSIQFWTSHGRYSDWFGSSEEGVSRTSRSTCTAPKGKHVFALLAKDARLIGIKVLTIGEASDCPELITPHEESQAVEWSWQPKVEDKKGKQKRYALPFPEVEDSAHIKEFKEDMYVQANEIIHQFKRGAETECVIGSLSSSQRHHLKELAADEMIRCSIERGSEGQQLIVLRK